VPRCWRVGRAMRELRHPVAIHCRTISHKITWRLGTRLRKLFPLVFVVGYPKSGTTWLCQLLADALQLPFPQHSLFPIGFEAVVHGHERVWRGYERGAYIMRDGRDTMVSLYFDICRFIPEGDNPRLTRWQRANFPTFTNKADVKGNLPGFIERQMHRPQSAPCNWSEHVRSGLHRRQDRIALVKYEDLLSDGARTLAEVVATITGQEPDLEQAEASVTKFSFARQRRRRAGGENQNSFLRKGQAGDWVNHFTREAAEIFDRYAGATLVEAGYEPDRSWVRRVGEEPRREPAGAAPGRDGASG